MKTILKKLTNKNSDSKGSTFVRRYKGWEVKGGRLTISKIDGKRLIHIMFHPNEETLAEQGKENFISTIDGYVKGYKYTSMKDALWFFNHTELAEELNIELDSTINLR